MKNKITFFPLFRYAWGGGLIRLEAAVLYLGVCGLLLNPDLYYLWIPVLLYLFLPLLVRPRLYTSFTFTEEGIRIRAPFKKTALKQYCEFPHIYLAAYLPGRPRDEHYKWREFLVFSAQPLQKEELCMINDVAPSRDLIKIRYSERIYRRLEAILPLAPRVAMQHQAEDPTWKNAARTRKELKHLMTPKHFKYRR